MQIAGYGCRGTLLWAWNSTRSRCTVCAARRTLWIRTFAVAPCADAFRSISDIHPIPKMLECADPIDVLFVISPHSLLLDIAGPAEAFRLANLNRVLLGLPPRFRLRFTGPS